MTGTQYFYLDGTDSRDYGIYLSNAIKIGGAKPNMDKIQVPGRNGDLVIYNGSYGNVSFQATCFICGEQADNAIGAIAQWTLGSQGYRRLEFPWEDGYRMGYITQGPETEARAKGLRPFSLEFSCKPQVFTYEGEQKITLNQASTLHNWWMPSLPQITVYGSGEGSLTVGETTVTFKEIDSSITLDSDIQDAFQGLQNKNSAVIAPEFPILRHGENPISWSGNITGLEIIPRWWHL